MAIEVIGSGGNLKQIETTFLADRVTIKPNDVGSLGAYAVASLSGTIAAGSAANANVFSMRYAGAAGTFALIRRVLINAIDITTAFTAGEVIFKMFVARSFSASDSGGTSLLSTTNCMKTGMAASGMAAIQIANTGALTAGTRTLDTQPVGVLVNAIAATANIPLLAAPAPPIFDATPPGKWPLVLATSEGFVIQSTVPATGTWVFSAQVDWEEVNAFGAGLAS